MNATLKPSRLNRAAATDPAAAKWGGARKALVIADNIGVFLAIARSLGRAGITVEVATSDTSFMGLDSSFVSKMRVLPSYLTQFDGWLAELTRLTISEDYGLIIPTSDCSLEALARAGTVIDSERLAIPNQTALHAFTDKQATRDLAMSLGVPVAKGQSASSLEEFCLSGTPSFPLVVKPCRSYLAGGREAKTPVRIIRDPASLDECARSLGRRAVILEEYFVGVGAGVSVLARNGSIGLAWQHRRIASTNETGRSSMRSGDELSPALLDDVARLADAVQLDGIAMFEFRMNAETGDYILIEVNPRFWGSLPLAVAAGCDFPMALWSQAMGLPFESCKSEVVTSLTMTNLDGEIDRISDRKNRFMSPLHNAAEISWLLLKAAARPHLFDSWAKDDPRPHWSELRRGAGRLVSAMTGRLGWP